MATRQNRKSDTRLEGGDGRSRTVRANPSATRRARTEPSFTLRVKPSTGWRGQPSPADIACRAFLLYLERGAQPGHDLDDWLQAERELIAQRCNDVAVA